jgi:hypothetical protein
MPDLLTGLILGAVASAAVVLAALALPRRDPNRCRVGEEWHGYFIGRRHCHAHNVVWDDQGQCPREGLRPGDPLAFASWGDFPGRR